MLKAMEFLSANRRIRGNSHSISASRSEAVDLVSTRAAVLLGDGAPRRLVASLAALADERKFLSRLRRAFRPFQAATIASRNRKVRSESTTRLPM